MLAGRYTDEEADDLMQFAGEIIDQDAAMLQRWAAAQGYAADLPLEVIFLAAGRIVIEDLWEMTRRMRREIDEILLLWGQVQQT
jgi:hypothetical protein